MTDTPAPLGWWTISGEALLELLQRCQDGESADLVYAEAYANSEITPPGLTDG